MISINKNYKIEIEDVCIVKNYIYIDLKIGIVVLLIFVFIF